MIITITFIMCYLGDLVCTCSKYELSLLNCTMTLKNIYCSHFMSKEIKAQKNVSTFPKVTKVESVMSRL